MTQYGICILNLVPVRSTHDDKSEMVTQLLFGEMFTVLQKKQSWLKIRIKDDNYEGWISEKQVRILDEATYEKIVASFINCTLDITSPLREAGSGISIPLVIGSSMPKIVRQRFNLAGTDYLYEGKVSSNLNKTGRKSLTGHAMMFLGAPYLWGGRSPFGIDCSGLVQVVCKINRIKLPRNAHQQAEVGETLSFISEARPGDLAFFADPGGKIIHTGIILEGQQIIHAHGTVRIDNLDHEGIFNKESGTYSHKLRLIKSILP